MYGRYVLVGGLILSALSGPVAAEPPIQKVKVWIICNHQYPNTEKASRSELIGACEQLSNSLLLFENVETVTTFNLPNKDAVASSIAEFCRTMEDITLRPDRIIIIYTGHGTTALRGTPAIPVPCMLTTSFKDDKPYPNPSTQEGNLCSVTDFALLTRSYLGSSMEALYVFDMCRTRFSDGIPIHSMLTSTDANGVMWFTTEHLGEARATDFLLQLSKVLENIQTTDNWLSVSGRCADLLGLRSSRQRIDIHGPAYSFNFPLNRKVKIANGRQIKLSGEIPADLIPKRPDINDANVASVGWQEFPATWTNNTATANKGFVVSNIPVHERKSVLAAENLFRSTPDGSMEGPIVNGKRVEQENVRAWFMLNVAAENASNKQDFAGYRAKLEASMTSSQVLEARDLWDTYSEDRRDTPITFPQIHPKNLKVGNLIRPVAENGNLPPPNNTAPFMWSNPFPEECSPGSTAAYCSVLPLKKSSREELGGSLRDWKLEDHLFLNDNLVIHCRNLEIADGVKVITNGHWLTLLVTGNLKVQGRAFIHAFDPPVIAATGAHGFNGRAGLPDKLENAGGMDGGSGLTGAKGADAGGVSIAVLGGAEGNLEIKCRGMDGGIGGTGGNGGNGAVGSSTLVQTTTAGKGGNGGDGGNGGTGGVVVMRLSPPGESRKFFLKVEVDGGNGGKGGSAGTGGKGSAEKGADGVAGRDGNRGTQGRYLGPLSNLLPN
jgi:hypothetical protein